MMSKLFSKSVTCKSLLKAVALAVISMVLVSCVSSGPPTKFYSLFSKTDGAVIEHSLGDISIGIGPVVLPDYLDNSAIVTLTNTQKVNVLGYSAWAGSLKDSMVRVVADEITGLLNSKNVSSFPWDTRIRPDYQVRVIVSRFDGVRGGDVYFRAKYIVINSEGDSVVTTGAVDYSEPTTNGESVDAYVAALNRMLTRFSIELAQDVVTQLGTRVGHTVTF